MDDSHPCNPSMDPCPPAAPRRVGPTNPYVEFKLREIEQSIPARFEQQVARYPSRLAVRTRSQELTYAELNRTANRVAHAILALRGQGSEPVALLFEHDAPIVAAILGVQKAGKFYLALDPLYPKHRTIAMLHEAQPGLIVTDSTLLSLAIELAGPERQVLNVDTLDVQVVDENPALAISPDAYAYLMFTSGSTGRPKGVVDSHRNLLCYTMRRTNACHLSLDDRIPQFNSYAFNASTTGILGALLNGASLHPFDLRTEGVHHLPGWLVREEITVLEGGGLLSALSDTLSGGERFPRVRLLENGGQALHVRDLEVYRKHFADDCLLMNGLGSTEMRNYCRYFMDKQTPIESATVPVGYPDDEVEMTLLGDDGRPVPCGEIGEITVTSRYLAPAIWRQPELTLATFRPVPERGDVRTWRSGDLGRMRPDGCLEHLGRKDFQVKIRGHRIELAEIESALLGMDEVKAAVVVARQGNAEQARLVAYLVPASVPALTVSAVREHLQSRLPAHMVPATFVFLEALPLTPNGKLDRLALPEPGRARPALEQDYEAPRTPIEELLTASWAEVLELDQVGIHDGFLELGGDSLLATRLASRVRDAVRREVPVRALLAAGTVAEQALVIAGSLLGRRGQDDVTRPLATIPRPGYQ